MTVEQQRSEDAEHDEAATTVTAEEIAAVDVEAPIRDSKKVDAWSLGRLYQTAASEEEDRGNETTLRVFGLLSAVAQIHFKPEDRTEPFGPQSVFDGHRSMIPSDLRGDQSTIFADLVPTIRNPGIRARLADIAWHNHRKLADMAQHAIDAYCEAVQLVLDGEAEFFDEDRTASSNDGCDMLRRACQLAHATGWKDPMASRLRTLVGAVIRDAIDRRDHRGFFNASEVALQFRIDDPASIAVNAESFAASKDVDPHWSHDLWELAAQAHRQTENADERDRCLVGAAEAFVTIADAAGGEGMVAASFIMDAIQALGRLPNTRQRRQALKERLRHAQASVRDEMGVISTTIDLTEHVKHARRRVAGVSLAQALAEFAELAASPDPDALRDEARRQAEENPLSSIMPSTQVDEDGKVLAKSPGFLGDETDTDLALRHLIVRNEALRRQTDVQGLIEPARHLIQSEHPHDRRDLRPIAEMTPFVPTDRVDLVTTGLARFLGGDFYSALHILVPQLENTLRHVLKHAGLDPSVIHSDMTQEDLMFSVMLAKEREALERIMGSAIVFEIENLFHFRGGPALRHQLAHGLISAGECYGTDSIYASWFIYRLYCLPLFPHWDHLARRLDTP